MTQRCFKLEEFAEILDLPAGDSRRRHVDACPRCRARMTEYEAFMRTAAAPGSDPEDAERRMRAALDSVIRPPVNPTRPPFIERIIATVVAPAARPAWAAAMLVVVATGLVLWIQAPQAPRVLRGAGPAGGSAAAFGRLVAEPREDGVVLIWNAVVGAETYRVRMFTRNLEELQAVDAGADTSVLVTPAAPSGDLVLWRVVARSGGQDLMTSPIGQFEVP